ncbi:hypothetical protein UP09_27565 [Bradyrhizobium sp. LTSP885]|uniref:hypothetical protein n=1 Tax=Bradyrhizobium sp. LTSP885 TaxID=1619232 RepID=UPI0005C81A6F|nr:hypothetical protein [Bradyrhizobium sp. LTSP885]KJC37028.1 hypothetical protein UP09_27565 [Bradyrhizobium sp. LTSP885]
MIEYRAYIIGSGDLILRRLDFECPNDDAANARAKSLVNGHGVELWQGTRKVGRFEHKPEKASGPMTHKIPGGRMNPKLAR